MDPIRLSQLKSRVSLVVCVIDALTSQAPLGNTTTVHLEGTRSKAIRKSNGSYIFNDLTPGDYRLVVQSDYYFQAWKNIAVTTHNVIEVVQLNPIPSYTFSPGAGLIRCMLRDAAGAPIRDAHLQSTVLTEDCARARLLTDGADKGALEVTLSSFTGTIVAGDTYLLRGRGVKAAEEIIRISEVLEHQKRFRLVDGLKKAYARGALLLPVQETRSTQRGEVAIAFRGNRTSTFQTDLVITYGVNGRHVIEEITVSEGTTANLGTLVLT
ncbi:peptidase associated/transthyretin-like domain-containing protein [Paenibacillus roseipurpureus]|uniref:ER membrane protein complex subunit 7 beta-sandwich domain-containing protein n=1 Tax=Paenibacillus roseopurpureus TaxID=2918901 RepID=A0AA96LN39_9BACL|nr:hypothetical protein [Paenibacillus sp. MBLB1832]WNR44093.1 hypothetical protein MJB10_23830 [Paenibacillus sp. MBLB1832]